MRKINCPVQCAFHLGTARVHACFVYRGTYSNYTTNHIPCSFQLLDQSPKAASLCHYVGCRHSDIISPKLYVRTQRACIREVPSAWGTKDMLPFVDPKSNYPIFCTPSCDYGCIWLHQFWSTVKMLGNTVYWKKENKCWSFNTRRWGRQNQHKKRMELIYNV